MYLPAVLHALAPSDAYRVETPWLTKAGAFMDGLHDTDLIGPWFIKTSNYHGGTLTDLHGEEDYNEHGDYILQFKDGSALMGTAKDGDTLLVAPLVFTYTGSLDQVDWLQACLDTLRADKDCLKTVNGTFNPTASGKWLSNAGRIGSNAFSYKAFIQHDTTLTQWQDNLITWLNARLANRAQNIQISLLGRGLDSHGDRTPFSINVSVPQQFLMTDPEESAHWKAISLWSINAATYLSDQYGQQLAGVMPHKIWSGALRMTNDSVSIHDQMLALENTLSPLPEPLANEGRTLLCR